MIWFKEIFADEAATDAGGGSAGADAPNDTPVDTGKDWKTEVERKEALLKKTQAKLAKLEADAEAARQKQLEEQGNYKALLEEERAKTQSLANDVETLQGWKADYDARQAEELTRISATLTDEQKELVALGINTEAQLRLARSFAAQSEAGSFGPSGRPGISNESPDQKRKLALQNRDRVGYWDALPTLTTGD